MNIEVEENTGYIKLGVSEDGMLQVSYGYNVPAENFKDQESDEAYHSASLIAVIAGLVGMTHANVDSIMEAGDIYISSGEFAKGVLVEGGTSDEAMHLLMTQAQGGVQ